MNGRFQHSGCPHMGGKPPFRSVRSMSKADVAPNARRCQHTAMRIPAGQAATLIES